jgi:WD40 repeat protein
MGIWSGSMDGTDVNGVDRSPSHRYLASADDFGKVNLFYYPALSSSPKGSPRLAYAGHSSHVTSVRWSSIYRPSSSGQKSFVPPRTDDYLLSIGGEDKCVFQWKHSDPAGAVASASARPSTSTGGDHEHGVDSQDIDLLLPSGGDEFTAVKPWLGAIVAPTHWSAKDPQKLPPFLAALGEYSNVLRTFYDADGNVAKGVERYATLQHVADNALQRMHESGIQDASAPSGDDLELDWVHGYRGFDCRNNLYYVSPSGVDPAHGNNSRRVIYYAAALGIVLDPITRQQQFFRGHKDDILAMAVYEMKSTGQILVATGQQGLADIFVWEVPSMQTLAALSTKQKTVQFLAFSADGRLLVSVSKDQQIVIADWKTQSVISTAATDGGVVASLTVVGCASSSNQPVTTCTLQFFTGGDKLLRLWSLQGRNLSATKYVTSSCGGTKIQLFLCAVEMERKFYVGCEDGSIYVIPLEAKGVKSRFSHLETTGKGAESKAKAGAVTAMHVSIQRSTGSSLLFTGSKDGSIVVWDASEIQINEKPIRLYTFNVDSLGEGVQVLAKQVQSIYCMMQPSTAKASGKQLLLLIGTRGCDMLEVTADLDKKTVQLYSSSQYESSPGVLVRGHCQDEVWGLAAHPSLPEYVTVGDDKTLRFYDLHAYRMTTVVPLGHISRTCCYNHTGSLLALGFGGRVGKGKETGGGIVRVYSTDHRAARGVLKLAERKDAKQWISDVKFTPDGQTIVAGAHDCKIYIYDLQSAGGKGELYELKLRCTFAKHNSVISHLDLSLDNRYMQSNCSAYELLFCDISTGKQIASASELKDVKWASWTCTLGWPVQGIWAAGMDGSDINAVARSHTGHLLATSDDFGQVSLFRYPVIDKSAKRISYPGHSSHVMNVRWTCGDEYLLSAGGNDKCIFQWKHRLEDVSASGNGSNAIAISTSSKQKRVKISGYDSDSSDASAETSYSEILAEQDDILDKPGGGDESGAVKPWLGAVRAPKNPPAFSAQPPAVDLSLHWVYGYSSAVSYHRPNLFYNAENAIVYPAAALGISLARDGEATSQWKQSFFQGHDDDVLCLAISNDRRYIATGQIASKALKGKGTIIVWNATECRVLSRMNGCHPRGVLALAFSPEASKLVSVGMDDAYSHTVWADMGGNWSRVQQIATAKGDKQPVSTDMFLGTKQAYSTIVAVSV